MRPDFALLDRLRREHRRQVALSNGLRTQAIDLEMHRRSLIGTLTMAQQRAQGMGASPRRSDETDADFNERMNDVANARSEARVRARERFRGFPPELLAEQLAALERPDASHFEQAVRQAEQALAACDAEIADLQRLQGEAGNLAGRLRATIQAAEAFLGAHPELLVEEVEEEVA
jgi:hypothetical protein